MSTSMQETKSEFSLASHPDQISWFLDTESEFKFEKATAHEPDPAIDEWLRNELPSVPEMPKIAEQKNKTKRRKQKTHSYSFGKAIKVPLKNIILDDKFRVRVKKNRKHVRDYKNRFLDFINGAANGEKVDYPFDPVCIWKWEGKFILIGGHHRFDAALEAGMDTILAVELIGNEQDALFFAVEDNRKNGLKYTYGDYTLCICKLVENDPEISAGRLSDLTGSCRSNCGKVKKKYLDSKVSTSGQSAKAVKTPPEVKEETSSSTQKVDAEAKTAIFCWDALDELPPDERILTMIDLIERFLQKQDDKDKATFKEILGNLIKPAV